MTKGPKILLLDIETSPVLAHVWSLWDQNVALNQIEVDWHLMAVAAKWLHEKKVLYKDQRKSKDITDDSELAEFMWTLLDQADIVVTQNGKRFDIKKLNARFVMLGMRPPSSFKHIDTKQIASSKFGFTSNKLEYLTDKLCKKHKKSQHKKFPGFDLWKECMKGNKAAWDEMERYNKMDVLSLEELYHKLIPWDGSINMSLYHDGEEHVCSCGSKKFTKNGFKYTSAGKYQRFKCDECGKETRSSKNLFTKEKRLSLLRGA